MARDFVSASSQFLQNSAGTTPITGYPATIVAWVNTDSSTATQCIAGVFLAGTHHSMCLQLSSSGGTLRAFGTVRNGVAFQHSISTNVCATGTWSSVVGRFTSNTDRTVVLNGDIANQGSNTNDNTPAGFTVSEIGRYGATTASPMEGRIAEVAMYEGHSFTDAEVAAFHAGYSPACIRPENLAAYWPIIGRFSPEIDLYGGFDMTLNNTPLVAAHPRIIMPRRKLYFARRPEAVTYSQSVSVTSPHNVYVIRQGQLTRKVTKGHAVTFTQQLVKLLTLLVSAVWRPALSRQANLVVRTSAPRMATVARLTAMGRSVSAAWQAAVSLSATIVTPPKFTGSVGFAMFGRRRRGWKARPRVPRKRLE